MANRKTRSSGQPGGEKKTGFSAERSYAPLSSTTDVYVLERSGRQTALKELAAHHNADAARELLQIYKDCHWRETKLDVIRALGVCGDLRGVEFLIRLAKDESDLLLCQHAIAALGESKSPVASLFLCGFYDAAKPVLKPAIVDALGRMPDHRLASRLLAELKNPVLWDEPLLLRNIVLTLANLRLVSCESEIRAALERLRCSRGPADETLLLSFLLALSKLSRDPKVFESYESVCEGDQLRHQILSSAKNHVSFRAAWSLEDYLGKLIHEEQPNRYLPFELNTFSAEELDAALSILAEDKKQFPKLCLALSCLVFAEPLYARFIDVKSLEAEQLTHYLRSIIRHRSAFFGSCLKEVYAQSFAESLDKAHDLSLWNDWLMAVVACDPEGLGVVRGLLEDRLYERLHASKKIALINRLVDLLLALPGELERDKNLPAQLFKLCEGEPDSDVAGRWLRAFGELQYKLFRPSTEFTVRICQEPVLLKSYFVMLSFSEGKTFYSAAEKIFSHAIKSDENAMLVFRALCAFHTLPKELVPTEMLEQALDAGVATEAKLEGLRFLASHPRKELLGLVNKLAAKGKHDVRVRLAAIVCLRAFHDDSSWEVLGEALQSEIPAVRGRALDTLISLPGLRAKTLVVDFLESNISNHEACEKVIRCLLPAQTGSEVLSQRIGVLAERNPSHPLVDGLVALKERMLLNAKEAGEGLEIDSANVAAMDKQLMQSVPSYVRFGEQIKSALRAAEIPLLRQDVFDGKVDKSMALVQYCKAVDLHLDVRFGQRHLFPRLESRLHLFQNVLFQAGLSEENPSAHFVVKAFELEGHFSPESIPLQKMTTIARAIMNGRILSEQFRVIDGLKSWAVLILLFARNPRLLGLSGDAEASRQCFLLARELMDLQELRNPAAHRQTLLGFAPLDEIRRRVFSCFARIEILF